MFLGWLGMAYAGSGRKTEALKIVYDLRKPSEQRYVSAFRIAGVLASLGEKDRAFEELESAYQERSSWLVFLNVLRDFPGQESPRDNPRFQNLLRRMNFPE